MQFSKNKFAFIFAVFVGVHGYFPSVWSEEVEKEQKEASEEKGEAEKSTGALGDLTKEQAYDKQQYTQKSSKVIALKERIAEADKDFLELAKKKDLTKNEEEKRQIMQEMLALHKSRQKLVQKHNSLYREVEFKYPGKGERVLERSQPIQNKTFEEMEKESTLDAQLAQTKKAIDQKYKPFVGEPEPNLAAKAKAKKAEVAEKKKKLRLER